KPKTPRLTPVNFIVPSNLAILDKQITDNEKSTQGIKSGCEAQIIWADSSKKGKTKVAFLYIHGFGASQKEAEPIHRNMARKYQANLYLMRLPGHGVNLGRSTMATVTADDFVTSVEKALAVAKHLGTEVIVLSNSFGGALSLWMASVHPEIKALVLYSPCIKTADERASIFARPWGLQLVTALSGSDVVKVRPYNKEYARYWTTHYSLNGLSSFQSFLMHAMKKSTFAKVKCPVFMGYWYKNKQQQDTIASVPAMLRMYNELGSPNKQKFAFENVANHEISTPILSKDVKSVQAKTERFLNTLLRNDAE
ncbi:MAG TPA: alpha/beta fold hydrolase, partial [Pedobacter sp.]